MHLLIFVLVCYAPVYAMDPLQLQYDASSFHNIEELHDLVNKALPVHLCSREQSSGNFACAATSVKKCLLPRKIAWIHGFIRTSYNAELKQLDLLDMSQKNENPIMQIAVDRKPMLVAVEKKERASLATHLALLLDESQINIYKAQSDPVMHDHGCQVTHMLFRNDKLIVGDSKGGVAFYALDGQDTKKCSEHTQAIACLSELFNDRIAAGSHDGFASVYDSKEATCLMRLHHGTPIRALAAVGENTFMTASYNKQLKLWHIDTQTFDPVANKSIIGMRNQELASMLTLPHGLLAIQAGRMYKGDQECAPKLIIYDPEQQRTLAVLWNVGMHEPIRVLKNGDIEVYMPYKVEPGIYRYNLTFLYNLLDDQRCAEVALSLQNLIKKKKLNKKPITRETMYRSIPQIDLVRAMKVVRTSYKQKG